MRQSEWQSLSSDICAVARRAGDVILSIYGESDVAKGARLPTVTAKADSSPVTQADIAAHSVICDKLRALTPDIKIVSEEDAARQSVASEKFWLVDPLDGTKEFLARNGEFTVNIALIVDGTAVLGVVHAPVLNQTYWGGFGQGAWLEKGGASTQIQVARAPVEGEVWRAVASKSHMNEETKAFIASFGKVEVVQAGSSLKFCKIADGNADIYPRLGPTNEWDTAAAHAVLEGAGGFVYDLTGAPVRYGKANPINPHFVAATVPFDRLLFR